MTSTLGFDTETHLIGPKALAPKMVCITAARGDDTHISVEDDLIDFILDQSDRQTVRMAHNLKFDLGVVAARRPDLFPAIFDLLEDGLLHCTQIREKLLNFTDFGDMEFIEMPDGTTFKVSYSLASLMKFHFGKDRSAEKEAEDAWRTNYAELEDLPLADWPQDAIDYAIEDAVDAEVLWHDQERRRRDLIERVGHDPFATLELQCMADFCLHMMSCHGLATDEAEYLKVKAMLEDELSPEKMTVLYEAGVLRPGSPPRPYANGAKNEDGTPKMRAAVKESVDTKALKALVESVCKAHDIEIKLTEKGAISTAAEVLEDIAHYDPVLEAYQKRQSFQKLVTTELPRMEWEGKIAEVVHPTYDVLKKSGRTSSYAGTLYPSFNCQNVDPRARACFVPREGFVLCSADYSQMELCTLAQTCLDLFGHSTLAEKLNEGKDVHAYLGAQIAKALDPDFDAPSDKDEAYELFVALKETDPKRYKHYRTFAKPTGLGYPGGLGPKTFIKYAKHPYGVVVDLETAELLREIWKQTFDEMPEYFDYINRECVDDRHSGVIDGDRYHFTTPLGMYRCNADYCSAANGKGLQSPSAEGAKLGLINIVRATLDPTCGSILYGNDVRNICFIHDENIAEIREDDKMSDRAHEIGNLMVAGLKVVCPDIAIKAEPVLMRRWDKEAKPVYENGKLIPWEGAA